MKKGKNYLISTLAFTFICMLLTTKRAYADVASPGKSIGDIFVLVFGIIIAAVIIICFCLIKITRKKNDNNKFN